MKRIKGVHVWFVLSMAAALAIPPLLLRAAPDGFESCARRVENMPQPERDRIEQNFREFLAMDESQRNHYREMHRRLQDDVTEGQGTYALQFENYTAWLRTIQPYRRWELRGTTDSRERLALMREIIEEEAEREESFGLRGFVRGRAYLPSDRYQAMMAAVERSIDMSSSQRAELESLTGIERTFQMFRLLADGPTLSDALRPVEVQNIIEAAGIESLVETWLRERSEARERGPSGRGPDESGEPTLEGDPRRGILLFVIFANVHREYRREVHERRRLGEDELRVFLNGMSGDERDRLLRLQPDEFNRELRERYVAAEGDLDLEVIFRGMGPFFGRGRRSDGDGRFRPPNGRGPAQGDADERGEGRPDFPRQRDDRQRREGGSAPD